jgi:hypothetical protein
MKKISAIIPEEIPEEAVKEALVEVKKLNPYIGWGTFTQNGQNCFFIEIPESFGENETFSLGLWIGSLTEKACNPLFTLNQNHNKKQ